MSPVIYTPPALHGCRPPMRQVDYDGREEPAHRTGTIWACDDCGQRWIVVAETYGGPAIAKTWWERHDKDTP